MRWPAKRQDDPLVEYVEELREEAAHWAQKATGLERKEALRLVQDRVACRTTSGLPES